jgi:hypothetical protein
VRNPLAVSSASLPLGVALLAVLMGIFGLVIVVVGILVLLAFGLGAASGLAAFGGTFLGGLLLTILGIIILAVAKGLWDQELWALVISIIVVGFILLGVLIRGAVVSLEGLILVLLLVYLVAVNRHFR